MNQAQLDFLNLTTPPARVNVEQASWLLGFQIHDISILVAEGLLKPLGRPARNAQKHFARTELEACVQDHKWLGRATTAIQAYWRSGHPPKSGAVDRQRAELNLTNGNHIE